MDKIDIPGSAPIFNPAAYTVARGEAQKPKDKGSVKALKKTPFSRLLEEKGVREGEEVGALPDYPPSEEVLQELLDDVHSAGDALRLRPLAEEIKQYKQAVRHFLHYVVENGYTVKTENYLFNHEKRRKVQIEVVDQKLEELASGILSGQLGQVQLLARLDEITGLLVDLLQ
ncbi:YaaR family protein [Treponema primitia]|uniref:YaaR family protein n=1 Tax=Treponema primitia TaxID=88058 RepID=UPI00025554FE|nr:YaaR family protein [Treponema primitia]